MANTIQLAPRRTALVAAIAFLLGIGAAQALEWIRLAAITRRVPTAMGVTLHPLGIGGRFAIFWAESSDAVGVVYLLYDLSKQEEVFIMTSRTEGGELTNRSLGHPRNSTSADLYLDERSRETSTFACTTCDPNDRQRSEWISDSNGDGVFDIVHIRNPGQESTKLYRTGPTEWTIVEIRNGQVGVRSQGSLWEPMQLAESGYWERSAARGREKSGQ